MPGTPVSSSVWAGRHEPIAELQNGMLSASDGIVLPNFHYVQVEHVVARREEAESDRCGGSEQGRETLAADLLNLTFVQPAHSTPPRQTRTSTTSSTRTYRYQGQRYRQ